VNTEEKTLKRETLKNTEDTEEQSRDKRLENTEDQTLKKH
jgi:hypothetical protein